jgi:hypothetical protein
MNIKKGFSLKRIIIGVIALIVLIQFFQIDKTNPVSSPDLDIVTITNSSAEIASALKSSCYDCHSNNTRYPWYANVAPVSWIIKSHIDDGRKHLNFSEWGTYEPKRITRKLEECVEEVSEGNMPMPGYVAFHGEAELDDTQKEQLINWFKSINSALEE